LSQLKYNTLTRIKTYFIVMTCLYDDTCLHVDTCLNDKLHVLIPQFQNSKQYVGISVPIL